MYIVKEYDFFNAIKKGNSSLESINYIVNIDDHTAILDTNIGSFICQSFSDYDGHVYMKVYSIL